MKRTKIWSAGSSLQEVGADPGTLEHTVSLASATLETLLFLIDCFAQA